MKINKKEKEFIEKFIKLYSKLAYLELIDKDEKKIEKVYQKICVLLPKYPILFKDFSVLYTIFNRVNGKKIFGNNFYSFLQWSFDELYKNKIINKKILNQLKIWLSKFNLESSKVGIGGLGGAGLG